MKFNYASVKNTTNQLLSDFGAVGVLKRVTEGTYDPSTGSDVATTTTVNVDAVVLDYPTKLIDNSLILQGDKVAYVSATVAVPKPTDILNWQGVDYNVISVRDLSPAGISVLYELQVRSI